MTRALIGTTEAAKRCGVNRATFFRWVQLGQIEYVAKIDGPRGAMLFDAADVDRLASEYKAKAS